MVSLKVSSLPNPIFIPLRIFLFARWNGVAPKPGMTAASWKDLKYYLRVMCGPHWKMTIPLCLLEATEEDVRNIETVLAYLETHWCAQWLFPMEAWTPICVFLIAVHALATRHPRAMVFDWKGFRDLIPHITPYERTPEPYDMLPCIQGLARLAKEFFPLDVFHYRRIYHREHTKALGVMFNLATWHDKGTQTSTEEIENAASDIRDDGMEDGHGRVYADALEEGYASSVHQAVHPRETHTICIPGSNLPHLSSPGVLLQIPVPRPV